jgi:hypothetical protein
MLKTMKAKFKGICCKTGAPINVGDIVVYDTVSRKVWLTVDIDRMVVHVCCR